MVRLFAAIAAVAMAVSAASAALTLADHGQSDYSIVIPAQPPASVRQAAQELQKDIELATGAKLSIVKDDGKAGDAFISLGSTKQAKAAGLSADKIPPDGFRIVTKGTNLYIIGLDTAAKVATSRKNYGDMAPQPGIPGPQYTENGGFSNGTANGVYTFLEDFLDVRWLMPGDIGRDVPRRATFRMDPVDRTESPEFVLRYLGYLQKWTQDLPAVARWRDHQKLGFSFRLNGGHSFWITLNNGDGHDVHSPAIRALYKAHPDWFAMDASGRRPPPKDTYAKLETTNPDLVRYFAEKAIAALKANPHMNTYSLSPSDGRGFSESPASKLLYDPPPPGSQFPSVSPLILKWYRDVSNIVAREYPQGKLAGFIYAQYLYPPRKGGMTLPDNFIPYIAPSFDYGYMLYRDDTRKQFEHVMSGWAEVSPETWFYYDLPNQIFRFPNGMLTPPAADILNFIFPRLLKYHIKGAYFYGNISWSQSALTNYIDAKLLWNPKLDAVLLRNQWLARAYGPEAGAVMERLYDKLNGWFSDYYRRNESVRYFATERMFEQLFGPHYPELERLYQEAEARPMTDLQKRRLQLIGDNLSVLQWRLRNAGYLPKDFAAGDSPLKRTDAQVAALLFPKKKDLPFDEFPILWYLNQPPRTPVKVNLSQPPAAGKGRPAEKAPNAGYLLLYAVKAGEIRLTPANVRPGSAFLGYRVYEQDGEKIALLSEGLLYSGGTISFKAKAGTPYLVRIVPQQIIPQSKAEADARYELSIPNAVPAEGTYQNGTLYLQARAAPIYVYLPPKTPLSCREDTSGVRLQTQNQADAAREAAVRALPQARVLRVLDEGWRFQTDPDKVGLKKGFSRPGFDDAAWESVSATDWWQNQGFEDYHGTAWYRKTFSAPKLEAGERLLLLFGAVDGDAEIYVNGRKVGQHPLGPDGAGWDQPFHFDITPALTEGTNTIAVGVTKTTNMSGIYKGVSLLAQGDRPGTSDK